MNIHNVKLSFSALFPLCLIMWSLAKSQLLLHPWQIDTDNINNVITSVTICEINHNMKTSNRLSRILLARLLLTTLGGKNASGKMREHKDSKIQQIYVCVFFLHSLYWCVNHSFPGTLQSHSRPGSFPENSQWTQTLVEWMKSVQFPVLHIKEPSCLLIRPLRVNLKLLEGSYITY